MINPVLLMDWSSPKLLTLISSGVGTCSTGSILTIVEEIICLTSMQPLVASVSRSGIHAPTICLLYDDVSWYATSVTQIGYENYYSKNIAEISHLVVKGWSWWVFSKYYSILISVHRFFFYDSLVLYSVHIDWPIFLFLAKSHKHLGSICSMYDIL